jgi:hypothetical protein
VTPDYRNDSVSVRRADLDGPGAHDRWRRVSPDRPCPICGRRDWCLLSADGSAVICPRTPSDKRAGEAGWLHRLNDTKPYTAGRRTLRVSGAGQTGREDLARLAADYERALTTDRLHLLSQSLGLSPSALLSLNVGWAQEYTAYAFPMKDVAGRVLGIRLRRPTGVKFALRGGKEGLFIPQPVLQREAGQKDRLLICEGPTDTAALLDLGALWVVGRPSCTGGIRLLVELVQRKRPREVVLVADADEAGRAGAGNLASALLVYAPAVRIIEPPAGLKDAREWLQSGATREDLEKVIDAAPPRRLTIRERRVR